MTQLQERSYIDPGIGLEQTLPMEPVDLSGEVIGDPIVRVATLDDIDDLVRVELGAYPDVYGPDPTAEVVGQIEEKYRLRVELLGDLVTVLERPGVGVYGSLVTCDTDRGRDYFASDDHDMTDTESIQEAFNREGKNTYVVNLAVLPEHQGVHDSALLFLDAIAKAKDRGVEQAYFLSRLPKFEPWRIAKVAEAKSSGSRVPTTYELVEEYWQRTDDRGRPRDPLMRMYTRIGAKPLELVEDAWKPDKSSGGYGVLFELDLWPDQASDSEEGVKVAQPDQDGGAPAERLGVELVPSDTDPEALIEADGRSKVMKFFSGAVKWAKEHKTKAVMLASAVAGLGYVAASGGESHAIHEILKNAPWVAPAYAGSLATYFTSGGIMLGTAGAKVLSLNKYLPELMREKKADLVLRTAFYTNLVSGVAAAGVVSAGMIEALPPGAWAALSVPLIDLYATVALRAPFVGRVGNKQGVA